MNRYADRVTHPTRKPFVREVTFIDDKATPPLGFFNDTQDHLAARVQSAFGWSYSSMPEEFAFARITTTYLGSFIVRTNSAGLVPQPDTSPDEPGVCGAWRLTSLNGPYTWKMESALSSLDGDFLLTCKIKLTGRSRFDPGPDGGVIVSTGTRTAAPANPGFAAGGDSPNWQIMYATSDVGATLFADSGVPALDDTWYRLQVSRVAGAVRWFINGALVPVAGLEGVYYPYRLTASKWFENARFKVGPVGDGVTWDSFHLFASRSAS